MKKSKIKMLTASACLALVGTASAAWVYAGTATESANIGVKVASYASAGEINVTGADNVYVYLDKGSVTFKKTDTDTKLAATHTAPSGLSFDETQYKLKLTYQVELSDSLSSLVGFAGTVITESDTNTSATDWSRTWTSGDDIFSSLPGLAWKNTYSDDMASEDIYKTIVAGLQGYNVQADDYTDSWYDQNKEWDAAKEFFVTITFKAEVVAIS